MLMNPETLENMRGETFEELLMSIRNSSLNASNLSYNIAMTFLKNIPSDSDTEGPDGRKLTDFYDDDNPVELIFPESVLDSASVKRGVFGLLGAIRQKFSRVFGYFRERKISQGKLSKEMMVDSERSKKFNISYADLMVPSSFVYEPKMLDIPLYDFRKKSLSVSEPMEARISQHEDANEHTHAKLHPIRFESNALFREKHPWLHPTMSFTKLWLVSIDVSSRIKLTFMALPNAVNHIDPSTSAIAWTLFERLILIGIVTKFNRKLFSTICFILAYKFNQDYEPEAITQIVTHLTRERSMVVKSLFYHEMKIFTLLDFSLKLKYSHIQTHIHHYLEHNNLSFFNLYDTTEPTFTALEVE